MTEENHRRNGGSRQLPSNPVEKHGYDWESGFDLAELDLEPASESQYADWILKHGGQVKEYKGRFWKHRWGFFQPIHYLARFHEGEIGKPGTLCWGYRAALHSESLHLANGGIPMHVHENLPSFGAYKLCKESRWNLRKCLKHLHIAPVMSSELISENGFELLKSTFERTGYGYRIILDKKNYKKWIDKHLNQSFIKIIGGFIEGRLVSFLIVFIIEDAAYLDAILMNDKARALQANSGLQFSIMRYLSKNIPSVFHVFDGLHIPEHPKLEKYKSKWSFDLKKIPAHFWIAPGCRSIIKFSFPHKHYRLTGQE